jgi:PIN domain nuclease of toxin-antitoxin system
MSSVILDASALMALIRNEAGSAKVEAVLPEAGISAVNLSEVVAKLIEYGQPAPTIRTLLGTLNLTVHDMTAALAYEAGELRSLTKALGLSLGDRCCLALARKLDVPALTSDQAWASLRLGVVIQVIR